MAGEIITQPAPLVGYHPPWQGAEMPPESDLGKQFINAFAKGVEMNQRRNRLESELGRLAIQNERLLLDREKHEDMMRYRFQDLTTESKHKDNMLELQKTRTENDAQRIEDMYYHQKRQDEVAREREQRLSDALTIKEDEAIEKENAVKEAQQFLRQNPHLPGSVGDRQWIAKGRNELLFTKEVNGLLDDAYRSHTDNARLLGQVQAKDLEETKRLIELTGLDENQQKWFQWPESRWGTTEDKQGRWIAKEYTLKDPSKPESDTNPKIVKHVLYPDDEKWLTAAKARGDKEAEKRLVYYTTINAGIHKNIYDNFKRINDRAKKPLDLAAPVDYPAPSAQEIEYMKLHPEDMDRFEARFGPGSFKHYIK